MLPEPDCPNFEINESNCYDSPLLTPEFQGKSTGELFQSAIKPPTQGGRKGEASVFIINQQSELKVGDEVPSDDARMADIRKITDANVPARERQQTWSSLLRRGGISTKPDDPTKAVVIAVVKTSGRAGQREVATLTGAESNLLAPQCHSWLAKLRSVVGAHQLGLGSGSSWTASLINTTPSTFRWNKATAADRNDWNAAVNTVFGQKPDDYQPKEPTFQRTARRLPMGTMSFAKDGTTVSGIYDTGAEVCVLSTRVALEMGLLPWDDVREARAANGEALTVHGVANGVETFHDGARLLIDFLIVDLDGEFDFLLGWNAIQHYGLNVDPKTGQLRGTDYDGDKFITKSTFVYTSLTNAILAGPGEEFGPAAQAAMRTGITAQLHHVGSIAHAEQLTEHTEHCESQYFDAVRHAHATLSTSKHPKVQAVMQGRWKDDKAFMEQVHPADPIWECDKATHRAQAELCESRAQLVAAISLHQECSVLPQNLNNSCSADGEFRSAALEVAHRMGQVTRCAVDQCFDWARRALKATNAASQQ